MFSWVRRLLPGARARQEAAEAAAVPQLREGQSAVEFLFGRPEPLAAPAVATRARRVVSRLNGDTFGERMRILAPVTYLRDPLPGRMFFDRAEDTGRRRDFGRAEIEFPELGASVVPNACVRRYFHVFDDRHAYIDNSLQSHLDPEQYREALAAYSTDLPAPDDAGIDHSHAGDTVLAGFNEGGGTWGHFVVQNLPRMLLFLRHFPSGRIATPEWQAWPGSPFHRLMTLFGITQDRIVPLKPDIAYRFRRVVLVDFPYDFARGIPHPVVLDLLRPPEAADEGAGMPAATYLQRAAGYRRRVENDDELATALQGVGLSPVQLGDASADEQMRRWRHGRLMVGTLGSDLTNIVFGRPGARLLALAPDWFKDDFFFELAVAKGMQWNEIRCGQMGERAAPPAPLHASGFQVDPRAVLDALAAIAEG